MPAKRSFAWIALVPVLVVVLASPLSAAPPVSTKMPENEPRPPEFVKKATWQETLVANREALLQWETLQDNLALAKAGAVLGPWYVLGPLSPKSKDLQTLRKAEKIDLVARYDDGNGREIGWQKCEQIQDGRVNDLTRYGGADKDSVLFVCRSVGFQQPAYLREVSLDLSVDNGSAYWLPKWLGSGTLGLLPAVRPGPSILVDSPTHQLLVELNAGADGRRRLCLALRSYAQESGGGTHGVRYDRRRNIYQQVRTAFAGPAEQMQLRWETEAGLWMSQQPQYEDWAPGLAEEYLKAKYHAALEGQFRRLDLLLAETAGVKALVLAPRKDQLQAWAGQARKSLAALTDAAGVRAAYYHAASLDEAAELATRLRSMRLAVEDHRKTFKEQYPKGDAYLGRIAAMDGRLDALWDRLLGDGGSSAENLAAVMHEINAAGPEILLDTPLLAFNKLLLT